MRDYEVRLISGAYINLKMPTQGMHEELAHIEETEESYMRLFHEVMNNNRENRTIDTSEYDVRVAACVISQYFTYWLDYVNSSIDFPTKPTSDANKDPYANPYMDNVETRKYHLVNKYYGVDYQQALKLDVLTFTRLLRDAYVMSLSESEEGRKYLYDCWRLSQTDADMAAIMQDFPKKEG